MAENHYIFANLIDKKYDILILTFNSLPSSELEPFLFSVFIAYLCFLYRLSQCPFLSWLYNIFLIVRGFF